ncbi:helix-turn-helix domain-containing protein [Streptomyces sp. NPDC097619]|uniref:AraC-like ligand-binding domain-containing protein n=1 Tax=Streptomyces sp. NPDC097619 TaxID=3157228 RepID=UPI00332E4A1A
MLTTVLDTSSLPGPERTGAWAETTALALVTTRFRFPDPDHFDARIRAAELGAAQLSVMAYRPLVSYRSGALIRRSDPELYQLAVITSGRQLIDQAGRRARLGPGDLVLYDSSRPFEAVAGPDGQPAGSLLLQFPRALMPLPGNLVASVCATKLTVSSGLGHVLRQTLEALTDAEAEFSGGDRVRMANTLVQLAAAAVAGHTEATGRLPASSRATALYHETRTFIVAHLHDPDLTPTAIAVAHHVSLRTLHRVYRLQGTTVGGAVRRERIARCCRDLEDPLLRDVAVSAIGARWGYPRASEFTRTFKAVVGTTPSAYRESASVPGGARS